jgi:hypothetical protein
MNKIKMRVRTNFSMLLLFTCFLSPILSSSQTPLDAFVSARLLDARLQVCAFQAFSMPKSGVLYDAQVPSNLTGIEVSAMRLRSRSFGIKGVESFKEFEIPIGVMEQPYFKKIVLVYHNLGNWSQIFYPLSGYSYLAPILGLLAYDGTNLLASNSCELELRAYDKPILVDFSNYVKKSSPFGTLAKCVYFDLFGFIKFDTLLNGNVCAIFEQGHVSIVVESNAPSIVHSYMREVFKLKIVIICLVGGIVVLIMCGLLIGILRRGKEGTNIKQLELEVDYSENMKIAYIGGTKVPLALETRTKPMIEHDYFP